MYCVTHCSLQFHLDEQMCNGKVGNNAEQREVELETRWQCQVWEGGCGGWRHRSLLSRASRVVCSSLELEQVLPPNILPIHMISLTEQQQDDQDGKRFSFRIGPP